MTFIWPYFAPAAKSYRGGVRRRARDIVLVASAMLPLMAACGGGDDGAAISSSAITTTSIAQPATSVTQSAPATGLPLVVDTDLAADDIVALSYLMSRPDVDLLAVTVSGTGEVRCPRGADVARGLLARIGRDDVPVACGSSTPLAGARTFPEPWRDSADNAYGLLLEVVTPPSDQPTAAELLSDAITSSAKPVVLLTLGPLTNVAEAIRDHPELGANVARIVVMGGAVNVPGNVQPDGAAQPLGPSGTCTSILPRRPRSSGRGFLSRWSGSTPPARSPSPRT